MEESKLNGDEPPPRLGGKHRGLKSFACKWKMFSKQAQKKMDDWQIVPILIVLIMMAPAIANWCGCNPLKNNKSTSSPSPSAKIEQIVEVVKEDISIVQTNDVKNSEFRLDALLSNLSWNNENKNQIKVD